MVPQGAADRSRPGVEVTLGVTPGGGRRGVGSVAGLVLAAGAGRRMGQPKALLVDPASSRTWVELTVARLAGAGVWPILVAIGARGGEVADVLALSAVELRPSADGGPAVGDPERQPDPEGILLVGVDNWDEGMGSSLRAGMARAAALPNPVVALVVTLVDLPDVGEPVYDRLVTTARDDPDPTGLAAGLWRATYRGLPGHPVLLGRSHWSGVAAVAVGDRGARDYLAQADVIAVECGDLASGSDVDHPPAWS